MREKLRTSSIEEELNEYRKENNYIDHEWNSNKKNEDNTRINTAIESGYLLTKEEGDVFESLGSEEESSKGGVSEIKYAVEDRNKCIEY